LAQGELLGSLEAKLTATRGPQYFMRIERFALSVFRPRYLGRSKITQNPLPNKSSSITPHKSTMQRTMKQNR
jgi:hypothetical protein